MAFNGSKIVQLKLKDGSASSTLGVARIGDEAVIMFLRRNIKDVNFAFGACNWSELLRPQYK